jgi:hypothetical protein
METKSPNPSSNKCQQVVQFVCSDELKVDSGGCIQGGMLEMVTRSVDEKTEIDPWWQLSHVLVVIRVGANSRNS